MKDEGKNWPSIRGRLEQLQHKELITLINELYRLNRDNQQFISAKYLPVSDAIIKPYKHLVEQCISPELRRGDERIEKAKARKAINDYWKATKDIYGKIDLMLYYVECGTQFTLTYGDIDEPFYNSLSSMFVQATQEIKKLSEDEVRENFIYRLGDIVHDASDIGWGYGDELRDTFETAFSHQEHLVS